MRVLLVSANRERLPSPVAPLGLMQIAAVLRDDGAHEVALADLCFEDDPLGAVERAVRDVRPDVVGVGIRNLHTNAYDGTERLVAEYADTVRAVRGATRAPIVLGGAGFSLQPETLLARIGGDHGVVGEGEWSMRALVDALARGETPARLMYAATAAPHATELVRGPLARRRAADEEGSDLDRLPPPARDLLDPRYHAFDGTENLQTKRGCAFACAYCDYPDLEGRKVRVRDPARVADELAERARVPGVTHAFVVDSVFNVPRSHAIAVCDAITARGSPLPWVCYGSPVAFDDEVVAAMARARCAGVEIGTDAGTDRMLTALHKPFDLAAVRRTRELFVAHDILDCHTFVLGALDETADEARATLDFVAELDPDIAVFIVFMEDREARTVHRARHRDAILRLLADEAPRRPGWIVPELGIRFGEKLTRLVRHAELRGPAWLHLARMRRATRAPR
jgi:radical SAM superfamily enzyme YgiQ (UPF0313 family)